MKNLVGKILLGLVLLTAFCTVGALAVTFASIGMGGGSAGTLTAISSALFAFSRIGLLLVLVGLAVYAACYIDFSGADDDAPAKGTIIDVTPTSATVDGRTVKPSETRPDTFAD